MRSTFTVYWVLDGDGKVHSGPWGGAEHAHRGLGAYYQQADRPEGLATVVSLHPLREWPAANYLSAGSVALWEHDRARRAGSGGSVAIHDLADGIFHLACTVGPDGDGVLGPCVKALIEAFITSLSCVDSGWDNGTVDTWARHVASFIGEELE